MNDYIEIMKLLVKIEILERKILWNSPTPIVIPKSHTSEAKQNKVMAGFKHACEPDSIHVLPYLGLYVHMEKCSAIYSFID